MKSTVSDKAYANMKAGFPKKKKPKSVMSRGAVRSNNTISPG
jgi:hypothetical protein